jgi:hypothetical protein
LRCGARPFLKISVETCMTIIDWQNLQSTITLFLDILSLLCKHTYMWSYFSYTLAKIPFSNISSRINNVVEMDKSYRRENLGECTGTSMCQHLEQKHILNKQHQVFGKGGSKINYKHKAFNNWTKSHSKFNIKAVQHGPRA